MPFESGSFTAAVFEMPEALASGVLERFNAGSAGTLDSVQDEPQVGWVTGRHLLETAIDEGNAYCGGCLYLTLRKAQRKIPGSLLNAVCRREELVYMLANQSEFVPRNEKKKIREQAQEQLMPKMPPTIGGISMVYDPAAKLLYVGAGSAAQLDEFIGAFLKTTGIEPVPWNIEQMLARHFQVGESALPVLSLAEGPAGEAAPGRDFLTWLWYDSESGGGVEHPQYGKFEIMIEGPFLFAGDSDADGAGETAIKKGDCPSRSAEAKAALSVGKKLKKARFNLARGNDIWSGAFDADRFVFGGLKLPEGEEMEREAHFQERMQNLLIFKEVMELFFVRYARTVLENPQEKVETELKRWVAERDSL